MKKIRISREGTYFAAIAIMAFSVSLMTKANLGLSMIVAPAYIISVKVSFLTFGQAEYVVQFILVSLICIITKRIRISYAFSFVTALIYGAVLDLFNFLIRNFAVDEMWLRVTLFVVGMILTSFSVSLFFHTYLSPCAYDFFVKQISTYKKIDINKFKLCFDGVFLIIGIVLTLVFFKKFVGVSIGTAIIAVLNGHIIHFFSNVLEKKIEFFDRFKFAKYFE